MSFPGFLLHFLTPNFVAVILLYLNILYYLNYFLRIYASTCAYIYEKAMPFHNYCSKVSLILQLSYLPYRRDLFRKWYADRP